jgi:hypothetical protein
VEDVVRTLTEAEGRVIAVLLGTSPSNERERLKRAGVPRSTYHAARRRAYQEGWLKDRYIPDPARFGRPWVSIVVARPFADRLEELGVRWSRDPACVVASLGGQGALGVFFHPTEAAARRVVDGVTGDALGSGSLSVVADVNAPEVPVYFDYEGLWGHLAAIPGTLSYPNGLGGGAGGASASAPTISGHQRWGATQLVHRPFTTEAQERGGHLVGPFGLPFSQQKLLRLGWVSYRVLLEPSALPPYRGRSADQVVFVSGSLRAGRRPEELFAELTRDCRVYPFLFATHGDRILLGALGRAPTSGSAAVAAEAGPTDPRRPVMATLQASLGAIEVLQEPASAFRTIVDHRYDRLLPQLPTA